MFTPTLIELGNVKPRKEVKLIYSYDDEVKIITDFNIPCGCTRVESDAKNKQILIYYTPQHIPFHLRKQGYYDSIKTVTVYYLNSSEVNLTQALVFTAKITNKLN